MKNTTASCIGALLALLCGTSISAALADTQKFVVIANGERVGRLTAQVSAKHAEIDYAVVNNGRGPKARERIDFDAAGYPVRWTIDGQSTFGSPVSERFSWARGAARWSSQADRGSVTSPDKPLLYIGNDASPWVKGVYVRQLLEAPDRTLSVLPSGRLRLTEVRKITLGEGTDAVPLTLYELAGVTLEPDYILVDEDGELFGSADGSVLREGYERFHPQLQQLSREVRIDVAERAQSKLAHRFAGPVRIRNVRIFDPVAGTVGPLSQVVVYANRIATVSVASHDVIAADETVIDGEGGTLVPGLHSHTSVSSNLWMIRAKDLDLRSDRVLATVAAMKSSHVSLDTTATALEQLMLSRAGEIQPGDAAYLSHMPIAYQRYRKRSFVSNGSAADVLAWRAAFQKLLDVLQLLDAEGIQLLPGTDDGNGFAQLRELELYVLAGMSPARALYLDTLGAARYLGCGDQLGTIERGKLADFLLVDGDPTQDIGVLRKNRMTMKDGVAYYPAEIYEHLSVKPFAPPPRIVAGAASSVGEQQ